MVLKFRLWWKILCLKHSESKLLLFQNSPKTTPLKCQKILKKYHLGCISCFNKSPSFRQSLRDWTAMRRARTKPEFIISLSAWWGLHFKEGTFVCGSREGIHENSVCGQKVGRDEDWATFCYLLYTCAFQGVSIFLFKQVLGAVTVHLSFRSVLSPTPGWLCRFSVVKTLPLRIETHDDFPEWYQASWTSQSSLYLGLNYAMHWWPNWNSEDKIPFLAVWDLTSSFGVMG